MSKWLTNSCRETKKVLGKEYDCCGTCHEEYKIYNMRDQMENYTSNKDYLFWACCGFPELSKEEWIEFEKKLEAYNSFKMAWRYFHNGKEFKKHLESLYGI